MASAKLFESIPPFPDDVIVANVPKISLRELTAGSESESQAMFKACCSLGFFLLDLGGDPLGETMIKDIDGIIKITQETMDLSIEEKTKYQMDIPRDFFGWKAEGLSKTETGAPDRCEFFNLSQDDLLGTSTHARPTPEPIRSHYGLLASYVEHAQVALTCVLQHLAIQLGLPREQLRELQAQHRPSGTILRMIRYQPSLQPEDMRTSFQPHTDIGTVTFLANLTGGLQVLAPGCEPTDTAAGAWQWVKPQPGCLIVNMGDAMVQWTGGVLRSNIHRVSYSPGQQRFVERYSLALLTRPYKEASMQRIVGGRIPTREDDRLDGLDETSAGSDDIETLTADQWERKKQMAMKEGRDCMKSRGGGRQLRPLAIV